MDGRGGIRPQKTIRKEKPGLDRVDDIFTSPKTKGIRFSQEPNVLTEFCVESLAWIGKRSFVVCKFGFKGVFS